MRLLRSSILLLAMVVTIHAAAAATTPAATCTSSKLIASGKEAASLLKCEAKAALRDEPVDPVCVSKAQTKLGSSFSKAELRGGCANVGDADDVRTSVEAFTSQASTALVHGSDTDSRRCAFSKRKTTGKSAKGKLKCYGKAARRATSVDPLCLEKFAAKLTTGFQVAETKGGCLTSADAGAITSLVDAEVSNVKQIVVGVCGDGVLSGGEQCDGSDDQNCPGLCLGDCSCGLTCGNGTLEAPEECDDGGNLGGDGCSGNCQLEDTTALCTGLVPTPGTALAAVRVASGLTQPVHVTAPRLDPNRVFIVEQPGTVRVLKNGVLSPTPFLDIGALVGCCGERGLLSLAFHPDYETNGRFFVDYTDKTGNTVVARYERSASDPDVTDPSSAKVLLTVVQPFSNHNGGQLAFGPDGYLYVGLGDGGGAGDPQENAQDDARLLGKILRMDVDLAVDASPYYEVPASNPNAGAGAPLGLIWDKGLRNPWRFSFDRQTGDLYIGDVGQNAWEEIDFEPAGAVGGINYGWDVFEGDGHCYEPDPAPSCPDPPSGFTMPVHEYDHGEGCSITGGFVYRGCAMPDLRGTYFYGDYCTAFVRTLAVVAGAAQLQADRTAELAPGGGVTIDSISSFGEDARGELYIADLGGEVFKIVPAP